MEATGLKELEWIHDCVLNHILYDTSSRAGRSIKLAISCPTDLGYARWAGKDIVVVAIDVAVSKHVVWGVAGPETLDAVRTGVSAEVRQSTIEARRKGARFPSLEFTISFHSGSALEIICRDLQVDVGS